MMPDEDNVSDDISEALMRGVITSLRAALVNPEDYTARSNCRMLFKASGLLSGYDRHASGHAEGEV